MYLSAKHGGSLTLSLGRRDYLVKNTSTIIIGDFTIMKRKENRQKVQRLFVVGAGASYSATATSVPDSATQTPLDKDFCQRILDLDYQRPSWVKTACESTKQEWKDHHPMHRFGLEQAITTQLGHLEFIRAVHPRRKAITIPDYLNDVAHLISFVLRKAREKPSKPYAQLVSKVFPDGFDAQDYPDRIITFNYDDLLDKHLLERFNIDQIYFDTIKKSPNRPQRRSVYFPHPFLLIRQ